MLSKFICRFVVLLAFACAGYQAISQDSSHIRISLLTCSPGAELYSTFGHTAIRVTDSNSVRDMVFNYGTFNFEDPGFYIKFIRGKLLYYLSVEDFRDFVFDYQQEGRGVREQLLNLTAAEKIAITEALYKNARPENSSYKYDFFFDNCTTRPRDLLVKYKEQPTPFKAVMPAGTTFRNAIHQYLDKNGKDWSKLGIDLLLGAPTDAVMTTRHSQFLPDNLMKTLDSSNANHQWVASASDIVIAPATGNESTIFSPLLIFSLFSIVLILLSFSKKPFIKNIVQGIDGMLFFLCGILGILFIFMWTATDHSMCKNNFNLLWAWPSHVVFAFLVYKKQKLARWYFTINAVAMLLLVCCWAILPQQLNYSLIPLILLLSFRSYRIAKK